MPTLLPPQGGLYCGGSARMVEKALGVEGDDVLYVGDHIYTDAALAKINFRWGWSGFGMSVWGLGGQGGCHG